MQQISFDVFLSNSIATPINNLTWRKSDAASVKAFFYAVHKWGLRPCARRRNNREAILNRNQETLAGLVHLLSVQCSASATCLKHRGKWDVVRINAILLWARAFVFGHVRTLEGKRLSRRQQVEFRRNFRIFFSSSFGWKNWISGAVKRCVYYGNRRGPHFQYYPCSCG